VDGAPLIAIDSAEDPQDRRVSRHPRTRPDRAAWPLHRRGHRCFADVGRSPSKRQGDFVAEKVLLLRNRVEGVADILERLPEGVPVYVAEAEVLDSIVGFHLHRGVLALGRREPKGGDLIDRLPERSLVLVGCGISNHDNAGSMFRNAAAFNADAIFLDETSCDPLYRKAMRVSVGSVLSVPYQRGGDALGLLTNWQSAILPSGRYRHAARPTSDLYRRRIAWRWLSARKARGCRRRCCRGSAARAFRNRWGSIASTSRRRRESRCLPCPRPSRI
jgi:tRNA G18 (ribose-2'-O)-methylase SpoU